MSDPIAKMKGEIIIPIEGLPTPTSKPRKSLLSSVFSKIAKIKK